MKTVYDKVSRVHRPLAVLLLSLIPVSASGLTSDRDQPVVIEADKATLNEKTGHSVYEGNVHLRQGTLVLQGDKMTVQLNEGAIQTVVLSGTPATYRQRPEGDESD
ncbi:MAG: lipopolysaccharide transport periplasmic protein LptA, partial [Gammaproteobacteria bacterium]